MTTVIIMLIMWFSPLITYLILVITRRIKIVRSVRVINMTIYTLMGLLITPWWLAWSELKLSLEVDNE